MECLPVTRLPESPEWSYEIKLDGYRAQAIQTASGVRLRVSLSAGFTVPAERMIALVKEHGLEGVVAKRLDSRYEAGRRSGAWQKLRVNLSQEFVVGGFRSGTNGVDSLVLGFIREAPPLTREQRAKLPKSRNQYVVQPRELVYCARVRAGFVGYQAQARRPAQAAHHKAVPVRQFAGGNSRSAGSRAHGREDARVRVGQTSISGHYCERSRARDRPASSPFAPNRTAGVDRSAAAD